MARGTWPDGVRAADRIPASAFGSGDEVGRFRDVAPQAGLNVFASAGGVVVDDLSTGFAENVNPAAELRIGDLTDPVLLRSAMVEVRERLASSDLRDIRAALGVETRPDG